MIFIGDIASPNNFSSECLKKSIIENPDIFSGQRIICNFEGLLSDNIRINGNRPILYNHSSVLKVLAQDVSPVLCLANNHTQDLPNCFGSTKKKLDESGILYCGAGYTKREAESPVIFLEGNQKVILFNYCWDFLNYNHKNPESSVYVAELKENILLETIRESRQIAPLSSIIVYLHWSLDLETLPYPMYRQFSRDLIDNGANVIVGAHAHCVQGGEKYKDGFIVYGLGNFFIPDNFFINGNLTYPDFAKTELVLDWNPISGEAKCHWFRYSNVNSIHTLTHISSEKFETSAQLEIFSPFKDMDDSEYLKYFRKNRRKKLFIPVFFDYKRKIRNRIFTTLLKFRARFAHLLARLSIIKWLN